MARGDRGADRRKRRRHPDDDDRKQKPDRDRGNRPPGEAGMRTSATTTAPASPDTAASGQDQDDLDAFFSEGHGSAMHYDRSGTETEAAESGASG